MKDFDIEVKTSPEGAVRFTEDMYNVSLLPADAKTKFMRELLESAKRDETYRNGQLSFAFPMRLFIAERA